MNGTENAAGPRTFRVFPREWGDPPFDPDRRAHWIAGHVSRMTGRTVRALTADAERRATRREEPGRQAVKRLAHLMAIADSP